MKMEKAVIEVIPEVDVLLENAKKEFRNRFGYEAKYCGIAPGRVNLIGEHTDYNDGFVLPMALPLVTVMVGAARTAGTGGDNLSSIIRTLSTDVEDPKEVELSPTSKPGKPSWANYVKGVLANFEEPVPPFEAVITTSVPIGGGVSSSASLEVATFMFLTALTGRTKSLDLREAAKACQKAEHEFANMPCGIMDQTVSCLGREGTALLLDCRSLEIDYVPLDDPNLVILITNSHVKHKLSGSEYPSRRKCCENTAKHFKLKSLRDLDLATLNSAEKDLDPEMFRRAWHVVTEIARTQKAAQALKSRNYAEFGKLMNQSHKSLRDDFEVSCLELDTLVSAVQGISGVYGSRMTGGGFGGCTVTLLKEEAVSHAIQRMKVSFNGSPSFYVCKPSNGCRAFEL